MLEIDQRWTQLGIVSFGNKCGEPGNYEYSQTLKSFKISLFEKGYPGVYTRVSEYMDWIRENTQN